MPGPSPQVFQPLPSRGRRSREPVSLQPPDDVIQALAPAPSRAAQPVTALSVAMSGPAASSRRRAALKNLKKSV